jgi:hypothetical protein
MDLTVQLRVLYVLGVMAMAGVVVAVAAIAYWLQERRSRAPRRPSALRLPPGRSVDADRRRFEHDLEARSAHWRLLV